MKKILILFFLITGLAYSQYSIPLRLVNSDGTPNTGEASNIVFTRYPHSYGTDNVSGLTVTEIGTAGNYRVRGFTTYEYVKLWLSGVEQTWFDSVLVGNADNKYVTLSTTQTVSGTKTFSGTLVLSGSTTSIYYPYLSSASSWYSDYTTLPERGLIPKGYLDRFYNVDTSKIYYDGSKLRLKSGYKLYGYNSSTSPILYNTTEFTYANETDGLSLLGWIDSLNQYSSVIMRDSTDELINYYKFFKLKKPTFYNLGDNLWDIKWYYESRTNSTVITKDSVFAVNLIEQSDVTSSVAIGSTGGYTKIDSFYVDPGSWLINWSVMYERSAIYNSTVTDLRDTIEVALKREGTSVNDYIVRHIYDIFYYESGDTSMNAGTISWTTKYETSSVNDKIYIYAKFHGQAVENALTAGQSHYIRRTNVVTVRVR